MSGTTVIGITTSMLAVLMALYVSRLECRRWGVNLQKASAINLIGLWGAAVIVAVLFAQTAQPLNQPATGQAALLLGPILLGIFASLLIVLAYIDHRARLLPDSLTISAAALGILFHGLYDAGELRNFLLGVSLCVGLTWGIGRLFFARHHGAIGRGDLMMIGAIGIWVGWFKLLPILAIASLMVLAQSGIQRLIGLGRSRGHLRRSGSDLPVAYSNHLAMGPGLCLATVLVWCLHG